MPDYKLYAKQVMPWIPAELAAVFAEAWAETGDVEVALAEMRSDSRYENYFPGNRREDGSVRYDEQTYRATEEGYARRFAEYGLGGDFLRERYADFFRSGKSPDEVAEDLGQIYTQVIGQGDRVRQYYAEQYGGGGLSTGNISDRAIFASALNPDISPLVYERQFRSSQIGGEAAQYGYDIAREQAEKLYEFGVDREAARQLFSVAAQQLPTLQQLQSRFDDPNDPLTVDRFTNALVINDPEDLSTINRLFSQERAQFSSSNTAVDQMGRLRGLRRFR